MKKTISALAIAVASSLVLSAAVQAETVYRSTTREQMTQPPIGERMETRTDIMPPRATVYSGQTLSGRRELKSTDGVLVPDNRVIYDQGGARKEERVREHLSPSETSGTGLIGGE